MQTKPEIFKAYDIRGVYGQDFDEDLAYKLGLAFAMMRIEELGTMDLQLVVASDMRLSSPVLKENLIRGLSDGGVGVVDIGLASTPTFYFAVAHYGYQGGIQVSASHNPKEYNGFKLVKEKAIPIGKASGLEWLRDQIVAGRLNEAARPGKVVKKEGVVAEQAVHDFALAGSTDKIKPFKVVIDTANGMGATYLEELFKHLPCQLIKMNWQLDGTFPAHPADPFKPENVADLAKRVVAEKGDLGIATDGDADRIFFVTETGVPVEAGVTRAILSKLFLADKPGAKVGYDVRPGQITPETISAAGGKPVVTKVGHALIKAQMISENIYFAGESSGHFYLNMEEGCYEVPLIAVLKMLVALSVSGESLSGLIKPYQKYFSSGEINVPAANVETKIKDIRRTYIAGRQNELDGISVEFDDYWFNVRASNTEPLLRLNLEAKTKEIMEARRDELLALIKS
jgi:phosphomannomutase